MAHGDGESRTGPSARTRPARRGGGARPQDDGPHRHPPQPRSDAAGEPYGRSAVRHAERSVRWRRQHAGHPREDDGDGAGRAAGRARRAGDAGLLPSRIVEYRRRPRADAPHGRARDRHVFDREAPGAQGRPRRVGQSDRRPGSRPERPARLFHFGDRGHWRAQAGPGSRAAGRTPSASRSTRAASARRTPGGDRR